MIQLIHRDGSFETLEWSGEHPDSFHGIGVVTRGGVKFTGDDFVERAKLGAYIACDTPMEQRRVVGALAVSRLPRDLWDHIR